ncbi:zinc-dependent alcohol dehydrogenase [Sphingomonas sp. 8AM]|uniref:zinc-dependent alcohol dehydrogenase n=1 Tax=Sphingomonas sp. 8AM TaxID=2653170 RepID=UPI0012F05DD3|nr:zinc-binding dehydrogenase [Sphingomonas sp. 8AM]VXD00499.1 (R,R)-butanediol dehydrogenase / meso-butanediol dehydrogenase / diacetyl reductase/L-iditol 2-dehydrogenase [Sphingomonas sp. 8AM]
MRAALKTEDGRFELAEIETPELPADDWVRMRVRVAGICGTDLRHWKKPDPHLACHVVGHELAGEIVAVGDAVKQFTVGDRVVVETVLGCGKCDWCRARRYNLCPDLYPTRTKSVSRAYAEYVVGPQHKFYHLPDHVGFDDAALVDTYSVCLHAHHLSGVTIGDRVAVIGAGPIGLGQLMLAKAAGAAVIVVDKVAHSLDIARRLGADAVIDAGDGDPVAAVQAFARGQGADVVFECVGGAAMPTTLPQATKMARRGGTVVIVGGFDEGEIAIPLEWQRIQMSEIRLLPSASFALHDIRPEEAEVLDLIARGVLKTQELITHRVPLDRINEAFDTADDKPRTGAIFVAIEV